jgi:putative addiction module component (TIGR02574 family)
MTASKDDINGNALILPEKDRADLIGAPMDSLDAEVQENVEEAWRNEIEHRTQELDSGVVESIPWEVVKARLARTSRG